MSALAGILIEAAAKVGAPIVKGALERYLGPAGGAIGGVVIDTIAREAGVRTEQLEHLPPHQVEAAVARAEPRVAELVLAEVEQQREANRLMLAELEAAGTHGTWSWAWRPATMWLIGALWLWSLAVVPVVNAATGAAIPLHLSELTFLTGIYLGLYMGGHTAKEIAGKWADRKHG
jgi:hypothetical protein